MDPVTRGDPESPLRWTSKSGAKLAEALREMGHEVVDRTVLRLLKAKGYSLQANKKTREGSQHPDRDAQFAAHQRDGQRGDRGGRAGDQRGRQEARADRRFQGGRPRV